MPSKDDVAWILKTVNKYMTVPITEDDVLSVWTGIRPLAVDPHKVCAHVSSEGDPPQPTSSARIRHAKDSGLTGMACCWARVCVGGHADHGTDFA